MTVNVSREDLIIFRRYLAECGEGVSDSSPHEYVVRKTAKVLCSRLESPPMMAPDFRRSGREG